MSLRVVISTILTLIAFLFPTAFLLEYFGKETRIDIESGSHLLALAGCMAFGFLMGSFSAQVLRKDKDSASFSNQIIDLIRDGTKA